MTTSDADWLQSHYGGITTLVSWTATSGKVFLASGGTDCAVCIWDPQIGALVRRYEPGHFVGVWALAPFRGLGEEQMLVSAGDEYTMRVWNLDQNSEVGDGLRGHAPWMCSLAPFDYDGRKLMAASGYDGRVQIWDLCTMQPLAEPFAAHASGLTMVRVSNLGLERPEIVTGGKDGQVRVWDPIKQVLIGEVPVDHGAEIWALNVWRSASGERLLASGAYDGTLQVSNLDLKRPVTRAIQAHNGVIRGICSWTGVDRRDCLATASYDSTVRVWNADTLAAINPPLTGHTGSVRAVVDCSTGDDPRLASVGFDGTLRFWDPVTGTSVGAPLPGHLDACRVVTTWSSPNRPRLLAVAGDESAVRRWDADTGSPYGSPLLGSTAGTMAMDALPYADDVCIVAGGKDGSIHLWKAADTEPSDTPTRAHSAGVTDVRLHQASDGQMYISSGSFDGTVKCWDLQGNQIGRTMSGHQGWVCLATFEDASFGSMKAVLASADNGPQIKLWSLERGTSLAEIDSGHTTWVSALESWRANGKTYLASASHDGTVRVFEVGTKRLVTVFDGHSSPVTSLCVWRDQLGTTYLASGDNRGLLLRWNPLTGEHCGDVIKSHRAAVGSLRSWPEVEGARAVSAGYDAKLRLWDLASGRALRTIEVGSISVFGMSDRPAADDSLGRNYLTDALVDQLLPRGISGIDGGPDVVTIDGPWGSGKTTLMHAMRNKMNAAAESLPHGHARPLRIWQAYRISNWQGLRSRRPKAATAKTSSPVTATAWFNPWIHQSGEQIWAGLVDSVIDAAAPILYPSPNARERYWFHQNVKRIDSRTLRKTLRRGALSPIFNVAVFALIVSLAVAAIRVALDGGEINLWLTYVIGAALALFLLLASVHTIIRIFFGRAADHVPARILSGPVSFDSSEALGVDWASDPLHRAAAGSLYMRQHDLSTVLNDLVSQNADLVIFVDDLDRCRPQTTGEVIEAINVFLYGLQAEGSARVKFVIGMDTSIIASHIDESFASKAESQVLRHGDDPSAGWSFLRKMIQMPVLVPAIGAQSVPRFVSSFLGEAQTASRGYPAGETTRQPSDPIAVRAAPRVDAVDEAVTGPRTSTHPTATPLIPPSSAPTPIKDGLVAETIPWRTLEQHPDVRRAIVELIGAQSNISAREVKRLLNVWQLYERVIAEAEPLIDPYEIVSRSQVLLRLADIVTRWPSLQRGLHSSLDGRRVLTLLAEAATDESSWNAIVSRTYLGSAINDQAMGTLRQFLAEPRSADVAELAERLL